MFNSPYVTKFQRKLDQAIFISNNNIYPRRTYFPSFVSVPQNIHLTRWRNNYRINQKTVQQSQSRRSKDHPGQDPSLIIRSFRLQKDKIHRNITRGRIIQQQGRTDEIIVPNYITKSILPEPSRRNPLHIYQSK